MAMFTRVLCPVDFSEPSLQALALAASVAHWSGARLSVLHVVPSFDPALVPPLRYGEPEQVIFPVAREAVLEALQRAADGAEAPSTTEVAAAEGDVVPTILDEAAARRADLVVVGTHGRSGLDRALLGSVAEQLMHRAACPVLTVPPAADRPARRRPARVLCPVDESPASLQAVGVAREILHGTAGRLTLLHVVDWPAGGEPATHGSFAVPEYRQHLLDDAHERMRAIAQEPGAPRVSTEVVVEAGEPVAAILAWARAHAPDLIVMGAQGRGGLRLALFGSTAEGVVRAAACPVLSVRGTLPAGPSS